LIFNDVSLSGAILVDILNSGLINFNSIIIEGNIYLENASTLLNIYNDYAVCQKTRSLTISKIEFKNNINFYGNYIILLNLYYFSTLSISNISIGGNVVV